MKPEYVSDVVCARDPPSTLMARFAFMLAHSPPDPLATPLKLFYAPNHWLHR